MANKNKTLEYTFTSKTGEATKFRFNNPGLLPAYELRQRVLDSNNNIVVPELHKELFEHIVRGLDEQGEPFKVDHFWFDEQEEGGRMLSEVTNQATDFIFQ